MTTKGIYTLQEDKRELKKQLGCMNGIFQMFDRRYLLGQRNNQKKLPQGGKKESNNAYEKPKIQEKTVNEKHRVSIESSRNSFSSSCSSFDCSKRVQTEPSSFCPSTISEPLSPTISNTKQDFSNDIKDIVKDSMSRKPRVIPIKTVSKHEGTGPTMTHVDSPRPLQEKHPKPVSYKRKDQNLAKFPEKVKGVKDVSRFSCDGRESGYKLSNIKDLPRLSLDSKQSRIKNYQNTHEPSVVARLMGLEALNDFIKKPCLDDEIPKSRLSRKGDEFESKREKRMTSSSPRIPLEPAPWKQEGGKKGYERADHGCHSVYGQIEKRLSGIEFKTSGNDLRALKHILEAIERTKMRLEKTIPPVSTTTTAAIKPANLTVKTVKKVNRLDGKGPTRKKPVSPSKNSGTVSPRAKNGIEKQTNRGVRKQSNGSNLKTRSSVNQLQNKERSGRYSCHVRSLSQQSQSDTVSFPSESEISVASQNEPEVTSSDWTTGKKNKYAERLMENKPMAELAMLTMEQPSPVSVLDAFYTEDTPSPIQKKSSIFKDDEDLRFDEQEWSQVDIDNLAGAAQKMENIKHLVHQIELLNFKSEETTMNSNINEDQTYIKEILLASGFLKNLDCATTIVYLNPTTTLINPELFNILEKTRRNPSSKSEKMKRKMIFDSVNNILLQILPRWKGRILNGEKIAMELISEINNLQTNNTGIDQYDEILNIIAADVNKKSEDWGGNFGEVPGLALDIERLIFKDLISEIVNIELQYGPGKHCRQLF